MFHLFLSIQDLLPSLHNRSAPVRAASGAEGPGAKVCKASEQRGCVQLLRVLHAGGERATRDLTRKGEGWRVTGGVGRGGPGLHQPSVRVEKRPGRTGGRQPFCFLGGEPSCLSQLSQVPLWPICSNLGKGGGEDVFTTGTQTPG